MKEENNNPNYNIGQLILAVDGALNILGFVSNIKKSSCEDKWIYNVSWDDNCYNDEPYTEEDIKCFHDALQRRLNPNGE